MVYTGLTIGIILYDGVTVPTLILIEILNAENATMEQIFH